MTAIYMLSGKTAAEKEYGRMVIEWEDGKRTSLPLCDVDSLVLGRRAHITMPLIFALVEQGTTVSLVNGSGHLLTSMGGETESLHRLFRQHELFADEKTRLFLARWLIREKIRRQKKRVKSYIYHKKIQRLTDIVKELGRCQKQLDNLYETEALRGCEGMASRAYFSAFAEILNQDRWPWKGRSRRPAKDPVNALLNLSYAFLEREVRLALLGARLDPRIGFFHTNNGRKDSLVYDLMELFRATVADHFVLRLLNYGTFTPEDFHHDAEGGSRLSESTFTAWCTLYEEYMTKPAKAYKEKTPRDVIRKEIQIFSERLFSNKTN